MQHNLTFPIKVKVGGVVFIGFYIAGFFILGATVSIIYHLIALHTFNFNALLAMPMALLFYSVFAFMFSGAVSKAIITESEAHVSRIYFLKTEEVTIPLKEFSGVCAGTYKNGGTMMDAVYLVHENSENTFIVFHCGNEIDSKIKSEDLSDLLNLPVLQK